MKRTQDKPLIRWPARNLRVFWFSTEDPPSRQRFDSMNPESGDNKSCFSLHILTCNMWLGTARDTDGRITQRKDWISGKEIDRQYVSLQHLSATATTRAGWH